MKKYSKALKKAKVVKKANVKTGRALPPKKKRVKVKMTLTEWQKMYREAEKYPLSMRMAAELNRGGISGNFFETKFHIENSNLSGNVMEYLYKMDKGTCFEPDTIPPIFPVFVEQEKQPSDAITVADEFKSELAALVARSKLNKSLLRKIIDQLVPAPTVTLVKVEDEPEPEPVRKIVKVEYPKGHNGKCPHCAYPLNGKTMRLRSEDGVFTDMHNACYWLHETKPFDIPHGMTVFNPAEGCDMVWDSDPNKPRWVAARKPENEDVAN